MIELSFSNKKPREEILDLVNTSKKVDYPDDNLLFFGDNLDVLSSLINSGYKSKVDLIYIDPPFFTQNVFTVSENRNSTISRKKDGRVAYSDQFDFDEFLNFIRNRVILLYELLSKEGSLYLHIDNKTSHYIKVILDEIFGIDNFKNDISRIKSNPKNFARKAYGNEKDTVFFYAKSARHCIWNEVRIPLTADEIKASFRSQDEDGRYFNTVPIHAPGETVDGVTGQEWMGMLPPEGRHWRVSPDELDELNAQGLIHWSSTGNPRLKKFADEHKGKKIQDIWEYKDPQKPLYPTEKNIEMLNMIVTQSSNEHSIVLDCFAGSGGTLLASANNNRRFIGVDSSKEAIKVTQDRLKSSNVIYSFIDFNELK